MNPSVSSLRGWGGSGGKVATSRVWFLIGREREGVPVPTSSAPSNVCFSSSTPARSPLPPTDPLPSSSREQATSLLSDVSSKVCSPPGESGAWERRRGGGGGGLGGLGGLGNQRVLQRGSGRGLIRFFHVQNESTTVLFVDDQQPETIEYGYYKEPMGRPTCFSIFWMILCPLFIRLFPLPSSPLPPSLTPLPRRLLWHIPFRVQPAPAFFRHHLQPHRPRQHGGAGGHARAVRHRHRPSRLRPSQGGAGGVGGAQRGEDAPLRAGLPHHHRHLARLGSFLLPPAPSPPLSLMRGMRACGVSVLGVYVCVSSLLSCDFSMLPFVFVFIPLLSMNSSLFVSVVVACWGAMCPRFFCYRYIAREIHWIPRDCPMI